MAGSTTREPLAQAKFVSDPEYVQLVAENNPERFNPPAPKGLGGNPWIDPVSGKKFPGAPGAA
jgi:hypothetical protein